MKRILLTLITIVTLFSFTGCGNSFQLDLDRIKIELENLETDKFSSENIQDSVEDKNHIYNEDIYDTEKEFKMNYDYFDTLLARKDTQTGNKYIVILPKKNKKEEIEKKMNEYLKKEKELKTAKEEYQGYLIYVIDSNPKDMMSRIKNAKGKVFSSLMEINKSDLESFMNIKETWVSESLVMTPMFITKSNLYIIIKPNKDNYNDVKKAIDDYMIKIEDEWKTYLPDQYELVKSRKYEKYGDYLIYIVSNNNDLVMDKIKEIKK